MPGDTKKYDYAVIDNCINLMKNKVREIDSQTQQLQSEVKSLMGTWEGSSATSYNETADKLKAGLDQSNMNLESTRTALQSGADGMNQTDAQGGKRLAQ